MASSSNKLALLLGGAFVLLMVAGQLVRADDAEESDRPTADEVAADFTEEHEGLSHAGTEFGLHDVIDEGVPRLVAPRKGECQNKSKESECKQCCADQNKGYELKRTPSVRRLRQHTCTCFQRRTGN